jgi:CheY-like chemotaxis protein
MAANPAERRKTLLCIDDNSKLLAVFKEFLEVCRYKVLTASNGRKGFVLLRSNAVDAVIVDYEMPEMNGAELAHQIRRVFPALPILMVSGYGPHIPKAQLASVDAVVDKNMFPEKLLLEISSLLDKASSSKKRTKTVQRIPYRKARPKSA